VIAGQRLWRTEQGDIVPEGHPDAAFLVVGEGCEVPDEFEAAVAKMSAAPANKKTAAPANKGA
jgi:hypothetical protein